MTWVFTTYCNLGFLSESSNQAQLTTSPRQSWNCYRISSPRPVPQTGPSSRSLRRPFHCLSVPSCWNREESRLEPVDVDAGFFSAIHASTSSLAQPSLDLKKTSFRLRLPSHSCPARALRALGLFLTDSALMSSEWGVERLFGASAVLFYGNGRNSETNSRKINPKVRNGPWGLQAVDNIWGHMAKNEFSKLTSWCTPCSSLEFWHISALPAHLPCCLVVVARGLYLARHLYTL